ncbi:MAG: glucosamine-6-phosphate deaminase [Candidatus Poribacteria bacterium]|nr:MAG: glucosamine-6-phosphate deaminase [Candidatus Poribacteria bacterium]
MKIFVTPDVDRVTAQYLLRRWPQLRVLGLATGRTPEGLYGWLVQYFYEGRLSFADKRTFNLDEYYALPPNHPGSYRATMVRLLMQYVDLPPDRFHVPPGLTEDVEAACRNYEAQIRAAGGVDLWILGIGQDGHIAFNEPGSPPDSRTRLIRLEESTRRANADFFGGDPQQVPTHAITVGIGTILEARELILLAKGSAKAEILEAAVCGPETAQVPASFLRRHPRCRLILDPEAAGRLLRRLENGAVNGHPLQKVHDGAEIG